MHRRPRDRMSSGAGSTSGSGGSRLPIFHDDLSFNDRRGRSLFDEMQRQMDEDFGNLGLRSGLRRNKWGSDWDDDSNSLFKDFFELRPRNPKLSKLSKEDGSSRESLDDSTTKSLFTEDPQTKTRTFNISFNVKDYAPEDISVKVADDTLVVEAKHEDDKSTREFCRKIAIPKEVDPDKLSSTMSNDGILTIKAPVPPQYHSITASTQPPISSSANVVLQSSSQPPTSYPQSSSTYAPHPGSSYQVSYNAPPPPPAAAAAAGPAPAYQDASHYPTSYPGQPAPSAYYAPPPATQPRMSAPVPQMQAPPMGHQSPPPMHQAHTMTSPSPHAMYYQQNYPPPTSPTEFPPPPPPQAPQPYAPMTSMSQDFPPPPPPANAAPASAQPTLDIPTYTDTPTGRRMDLTLFLGPPYTPEDILVKVDGKTLIIEANHMEKKDNKTSKASMSREFELAEDINPQTVQANLTTDGHLKLAAMVPLPSDLPSEEQETEPPPAPTSEAPAQAPTTSAQQ